MIIECVNCNKKFNVNSELIPNEGRSIQCGSCNHIWFFNINDEILASAITQVEKENKPTSKIRKETKKKPPILDKKVDKIIDKRKIDNTKNKGSEIVKYQPQSTFTFSNFLSYVLVGIVSIIGFVIILDTFKSSLYGFFPNLEFILFSLYETLKDIELFVKDLI